MDNKKNIVFIMNNLRAGGAEKALISLLQVFDYSQYNVDLLLFKKEGLFLNQVPKEVTILDEPIEYQYFDMAIAKAVKENLKNGRFDIIWNRLMMGYLFKTEKNVAVREQKLWKYLGRVLPKLSKKYDAAIGFLEKTPNYYCVDKVEAKVKIGFIHNDYEKLKMLPIYDTPYFDKLNYVATVSEECLASLQRCFPNHIKKLIKIENISSSELIKKLAQEKIDYQYNGVKLISIGRLTHQKGYDFSLDAAKILKDKGIDFKWYILGIGELQNQLNAQVKQNDLQENIEFLGLKENPYSYISQADIFMQTSRFEGKSVAIDEAKILQKPILVTDFPSAKDQIKSEVTGLIVAMNPQAIADGVIKIIDNESLRKRLQTNLSLEMIGNEDEVKKIYKII